MSDAQPLIGVLLQWGAWFLLIALGLTWLSRTRHRAPEQDGADFLLRSPPVMLWLGIFGMVFFTALAVVSAIAVRDGHGPLYFWMFFSLALLGVPVLAEYFIDSYVVRRDGLQYRTLMAGEGFARWDEVVQVHYVPQCRWYRLLTVDGRVIRVSALMVGLPEFAEAVLERTQAGAVLRGAMRELRAARARRRSAPQAG